MIGVDLFSGAGGMSLGAEAAGIRVVSAVESNRWAAATYATNRPDVKMHARDICSVFGHDLHDGPESPFVVFGGPPCQGFSTSNQRTRSSTNAKNWLFGEYLRLIEELRPKWVVFENVKGILETESGMFVKAVHEGMQRLGYTTSQWVLNAADFGVPQRRWRVFIVGSRDGLELPKPNILPVATPTLRDAIHDLPVLRNGADKNFLPYRKEPHSCYAEQMRGLTEICGNHLVTRNSTHVIERYSAIAGGGNWKSIPEHLMSNYKDRTRCHTGIYHRLAYEQPSIVIGNFRKNMLIHPTQARGLSVREAARIQSFPDSYCFQGTIGFQQQQVGNAVPPLLAQAVFAAIIDHS